VLTLFVTVFGFILVAELPDKTAFACIMMGMRYRRFPVFVGAAAAFVVQSAIGVALGSLIAMLPHRPVEVVSALMFVAMGVWMWRHSGEADAAELSQPLGFWRTAGTAFMVVFVAEFGDLTQIGTAAMVASSHQPLVVFVAATLALWCVTALTVFVGGLLKTRLKGPVVHRVAAVITGLIGLWLLWVAGTGGAG
jgi:putative Ca2+/H+ antiporter (TMEM165/GDT1 family)